jgi:voltage-gated potassium channel
MQFLFVFLKYYGIGLYFLSPVLLAIVLVILVLGFVIGRKEKWSRSDTVYYAFITATTVGYGDFHPENTRSKYLAVSIALLGLLMTGLLVSIGLEAVSQAFHHIYNIEEVQERFNIR